MIVDSVSLFRQKAAAVERILERNGHGDERFAALLAAAPSGAYSGPDGEVMAPWTWRGRMA